MTPEHTDALRDDDTPRAAMWQVRADDGARHTTPRNETRECFTPEELREAWRAACRSFAGVDGARVELWMRRDCGDLHLEVAWIWSHADRGRWSHLTSPGGTILAAVLLCDLTTERAAEPTSTSAPGEGGGPLN